MSDAIDEMVAQRRQALAGLVGRDDPLWGLALSGGGIRSATFCLGLVKALAREGLLLRFDLLSTVSGGGFIGATLGRLFQGVRDGTGSVALQAALARAETLACGDWLRRHGRYLIPRGSADLRYAAAIMLRNLLGVHMELGFLALLAGCLLAAVNLLVWGGMELRGLGTTPGALLTMSVLTGARATAWLFLPLAGMLFVVAGCAYWATEPFSWATWRKQLCYWLGWLGALYLLLGGSDLSLPAQDDRPLFSAWLVALVATLAWLAAFPCLWLIWLSGRTDVARVRQRLSNAAGQLLQIAVLLVALGAFDRLAWWLAFEAHPSVPPAALLIALAAVFRGLLPKLGDASGGSGALSRYGLMFANGLGLLLAFTLAAWWASLVYRLSLGELFLRDGLQWAVAAGNLVLVTLPLVVYALITGSHVEFLNLSSLHLFYRARLVRSYLGAGNPARFPEGPLAPAAARTAAARRRIDEVNDEDDLALSDYAPHLQGGPVHLINVCVNQTLGSPEGGRRDFNVDRRGQLMTVAPQGGCRLGNADWLTLERGPAMTLGTWTAISGAAFSPGLGSMTRGGLATLAMFSGVRLGYWWSMAGAPVSGWLQRSRHLFDKSIRVLSETLARFRIEPGQPMFLTDGGHFENTGAYALLRERAGLIVLADCGADPGYAFADLENLVRKARIDLQVVIDFVRPRPDAPALLRDTFGALADLASPRSPCCFALAQLSYLDSGEAGWLVLVKPNMCRGLPVDLENFKAAHPEFPQQATTDQFFDESQWESYRRLGEALGSRLTAPLLTLLQSQGAACVERDDGSLSAEAGRAEAAESARLGARLAQRLAGVTVGHSLGFGAALAAVGVPVWQGVEAFRGSLQAEDQADRAALKEISDKWGQLQGDAPGPVGALAAALVRTQDILCPRGEGDWFRRSTLAREALTGTLQACKALAEATRPPACQTLVDQASGSCLIGAPLPRAPECPPAYWGRDWPALGERWASAALRPAAGSEQAVRDEPGKALCDSPTDWRSEVQGVRLRLKDAFQDSWTQAVWQHSLGRIDLIALPRRTDSAPPVTLPAPSTSPTGRPAASAPGMPPPASAAPAVPDRPREAEAAASACFGFTVYVQIYGPTARTALSHVAALWRANAASPKVPGLEDVYASADRAARRRPQPYAQTTVLYRLDEATDAKACIRQLQTVAAQDPAIVAPSSWQLKAFPASLQPPRRVIEVWYVQQAAANTAKQ